MLESDSMIERIEGVMTEVFGYPQSSFVDSEIIRNGNLHRVQEPYGFFGERRIQASKNCRCLDEPVGRLYGPQAAISGLLQDPKCFIDVRLHRGIGEEPLDDDTSIHDDSQDLTACLTSAISSSDTAG